MINLTVLLGSVDSASPLTKPKITLTSVPKYCICKNSEKSKHFSLVGWLKTLLPFSARKTWAISLLEYTSEACTISSWSTCCIICFSICSSSTLTYSGSGRNCSATEDGAVCKRPCLNSCLKVSGENNCVSGLKWLGLVCVGFCFPYSAFSGERLHFHSILLNPFSSYPDTGHWCAWNFFTFSNCFF